MVIQRILTKKKKKGNKMEFKFSDKTIEMFNELSKNITADFNEKAIREQIELQAALKDIAKHGKILYIECLKQGFDFVR